MHDKEVGPSKRYATSQLETSGKHTICDEMVAQKDIEIAVNALFLDHATMQEAYGEEMGEIHNASSCRVLIRKRSDDRNPPTRTMVVVEPVR